MTCRQCGHANEPAARFCSSCGAPLDGDESTASLAAIEPEEARLAAHGPLDELPEGVAVVVVQRGPNAGSVFGLERDQVSAGRHPDSQIFLDDITVSRHHAVIDHTDTGFAVRDVGSLNGTYVNHERVEDAPLHDGDEIQIGRYVLTFHLGQAGPAGRAR
jgi:pSer/pThr/pTyr-binding forkhead associated (FHA) protein